MIYGKTELKRRLSDIMRKGWTNQQVKDLVDSLWRTPSQNHAESGTTEAENTSIEVTFQTPFKSDGYFLSIQAFRESTIEGNKKLRQEIPYHSLVQTETGFQLTLEEYYPGDTLRYFAHE